VSAVKLVQVVALIKRRRTRTAAHKRAFSQHALRAGVGLLAALGLVMATLATASLPLYLYLTQSLPPAETLEALLDPQYGELLLPTRFVDRTGQQVLLSLEPPAGPRSFVAAADNYYLAAAFIASQDPGFGEVTGRDLLDLDRGPQGIAEHLVSKLLLTAEPEGWVKSLRARILAADVVAKYGYQQVLTWALNTASFGYWTFGVESATRLYFDKPAAQLSLAEAALLAAVGQAPALNPLDAPELAIEYQHLILASMHDQALISDDEYEAALAEPLEFSIGAVTLGSQTPEFMALALQQAEAILGAERLQLGGLTVVTTLDYDIQQAASDQLAGTASELVVLDTVSGQILALVGAASENKHPATNVLTPFIYLNIFAQGQAPASMVWDLPQTTTFSAADYQGPLTMRQALATGRLSPVEGWIEQVDENLADLFVALGFDNGRSQVSALNVAAAYSILANSGMLAGQADNDQIRPGAILFAGDANDRAILNLITPSTQVITSPELAFLVTDVLADASLWPSSAPAPSDLNRPLAIFQSGEDEEWHVGYSPQRTVAFWTEADATEPDQFFSQLLDSSHQNLPVKNWNFPPGLSSLTVCVPSGLLPDEDCLQTRRELFLFGNEPTETDSLYQRVAINKVSDKLATVFTPQEFIEARLYLNLPPEAKVWARRSDLELPPENYDPVSLLELQRGPLLIAQPASFSEVSGVVDIVGLLAEGTVAYDIQVGQGLFPTQWMLLTERKANSGVRLRAEWDTRGLDGAWAIQLQAWDEAGNLTRAYAIVTIVN